jgi:hypothetical protein
MRRIALVVAVLACTAAGLAKDKPRITLQVVDAQKSQRQWTHYDPGTPARSTTDCDTNATANDYGTGTTTINGTTNCSTVTQPGRAPATRVHSVEQTHVRAIMPDGTHVTLWCQAGFRHCSSPSPGYYSAEVNGNTVWMYGHDLSGKEHKIKYHWVGGW